MSKSLTVTPIDMSQIYFIHFKYFNYLNLEIYEDE